jgi:hypothetical protein
MTGGRVACMVNVPVKESEFPNPELGGRSATLRFVHIVGFQESSGGSTARKTKSKCTIDSADEAVI